MSDQDDDVGYKRPPRHSRFVKGKSGNPKGRPRKDRSSGAADRLLDEPCVWFSSGGTRRRITGREAMYRGQIKQALAGDVASAIAILTEEIRLMRQVADMELGPRSKEAKKRKVGFVLLPERPTWWMWEAVAVPAQRRLMEAAKEDVK